MNDGDSPETNSAGGGGGDSTTIYQRALLGLYYICYGRMANLESVVFFLDESGILSAIRRLHEVSQPTWAAAANLALEVYPDVIMTADHQLAPHCHVAHRRDG